MELKEFISDVLLQIAEGVTDANQRYKELGGFVIRGEVSKLKEYLIY